jgi:hypothetical protein
MTGITEWDYGGGGVNCGKELSPRRQSQGKHFFSVRIFGVLAISLGQLWHRGNVEPNPKMINTISTSQQLFIF